MNSGQTIAAAEAGRSDSTRESLRIPELLAPAGDWECVRAAVENGADAIYFGLEKFNARMRANNFTEADLPKLMEFLHRRGVKGYVTFNILVFENEMLQAEQYLRTIIAAGVDAAVVQDVGACRLIRQVSPDFPIHGSTQMTISSVAGVEFARALGCDLVVLARECSLKEIACIVAGDECRAPGDHASRPTPHAPLPLEVFIHGALCVAYSGQCLTSEALGGRSANRGECAQACRMPYDLMADGKPVSLGDRRYLLSPQDLAGLDVLPELVRAGVASLKIEGRLKSPEYVANITRIYRQALDRLAGSAEFLQSRAGVPPAPAHDSPAGKGRRDACPTLGAADGAPGLTHRTLDTQNPRYEMEMAFSRGLSTGWFGGTNNQQLVHGRFGKKRGVYLGEVARVDGERVAVNLQGPLKLGDGIVFDAGRPEEQEEGGRVYGIETGRDSRRSLTSEGGRDGRGAGETPALLSFGRGDIDFRRVHVGDRLWKTSDPELDRRLRQSFEGDAPRFPRPISMEVHGLAGKPLTLIVRDELGHVVRLDSAMPLARAEKQPLATGRLREQLGRLGGTPFTLGELKNQLAGEVMLPVSELNRLRREAATELEAQRSQPKRWTLHPATPAHPSFPVTRHPPPATPKLIVLVRTLPQLEAALRCSAETIYCEFEDPKKYREAVAQFRNAPLRPAGSRIFVAPPRVFKMGEEWTLKQVRSCEADGYLVRNYDHLEFFAGDCRIGDYSLNVANRLTADYFKNKFGLERVTASYDLNSLQLEALLQASPPEWFEVTIHQHIPMFHMEHCIFCAFLSTGTDYTNCGRPCDHHDLKLRDRVRAEHPVKADVGCRNTVFNALAQTGADYVSRMIALGVRHFRIEFLSEDPGAVEQTIARYRQLLRGEITGADVWHELKLLNQLGVTRGQIGGPRLS
jgi:putative protease